MTLRQQFLKAVYPVWMRLANLLGNNKVRQSNLQSPPVPFHSLSFKKNDGTDFNFQATAGKKLLLVNTASNCGYTNQYAELQQLYEQYKDRLLVIGFPSNDFKEQEKGNDEEIARFCQVNFGVSFPLMTKSVVSKSAQQNPVFNWLTDPAKNGWNDTAPSWNFSKYLVDEQGRLLNYFDPAVSPLSDDIKKLL